MNGRQRQAVLHHRNLYHLLDCDEHTEEDLNDYLNQLTDEELRDITAFQLGREQGLRQKIEFWTRIRWN